MEKKQLVQALALGTVLVVNLSATAYAQTAACNNGTATSIASSATGFVKNDFTPKCSANVYVNYNQTNTDFFVKGASSKGMHTYGGSTMGGGVGVCENSSVTNPHSSVTPGTTSGTQFPAGC